LLRPPGFHVQATEQAALRKLVTAFLFKVSKPLLELGEPFFANRRQHDASPPFRRQLVENVFFEAPDHDTVLQLRVQLGQV